MAAYREVQKVKRAWSQIDRKVFLTNTLQAYHSWIVVSFIEHPPFPVNLYMAHYGAISSTPSALYAGVPTLVVYMYGGLYCSVAKMG